jgi:hypothetical protein
MLIKYANKGEENMSSWFEEVEKTAPRFAKLKSVNLGKLRSPQFRKVRHFGAMGSFIGLCLLVNSMLITTKSQRAHADAAQVMTIQGQQIDITARKEHMAIPLQLNDGLAVTTHRGKPADAMYLSKNPEVVLTSDQVDLAKHFMEYLAAHHDTAVITSGERSPEGQLDIIRQRISERGVSDKFPGLDSATLSDTKVWFSAWTWLRSQHVPVNAPADIEGKSIKTSMHLKGMAMDFIATSLDQLDKWFVDFSKSKYGKDAALRITGIVREPGCIHINLALQA